MHIRDILANRKTTFSFEFFPPKSDAAANLLFDHIRQLESLKPDFVSVTYGAAGTTRQRTHDLVLRIKQSTSLDPVPHLTCVSHSHADIHAILQRYAAAHVSNILALAGDPPLSIPGNPPTPQQPYDRSHDPFQHAADLVAFIRQFNRGTGGNAHPDPRGFGIGVAGFPEGHPATPNRTLEMDYLKAKVDAGADYIVTQLFFDNRDFYDFRERCELAHITVPILAGLMPITSLNTYKRIPQLALGARYPARLQRAILRAAANAPAPAANAPPSSTPAGITQTVGAAGAGGGDPDPVKSVGIHWATEQARDLLDHQVRGIHFYTLNNSLATRQIYQTLGAKDSTSLSL